jgi:hypothetical protein
MKFNVKQKSGRTPFEGSIDKRYSVVTKEGTSSMDEVQFWTWLKYTFPRMDFNTHQKVLGCSDKDLVKIRNEWQEKFDFQN